jgi:hypothetical protein
MIGPELQVTSQFDNTDLQIITKFDFPLKEETQESLDLSCGSIYKRNNNLIFDLITRTIIC